MEFQFNLAIPSAIYGRGTRSWNKFPIYFLFPKNTREKNKSPIFTSKYNDLSCFEAYPCSFDTIRHDVDRQDKFSFSFYDERRALNNAGEINPCHELRTRRLKGLKKKKEEKKRRKKWWWNGRTKEDRHSGHFKVWWSITKKCSPGGKGFAVGSILSQMYCNGLRAVLIP